jgi:Holliday junction DNA helicase RuvA
MISHLKGTLVQKTPTEAVVDVQGVGYRLSIPLSTYEKLPSPGQPVSILTHLAVREDALQLYGFSTEGERELFRSLILVSGIGPKIAQGILSGLSVGELQDAILNGDIPALTAVSGVGRKTAERIILELKNKIGRMELKETAREPRGAQLKERTEAIVALMSLGYSRGGAEAALRLVLAEPGGQALTIEEMIKRALHHSPRQ